MSKKAALLIPLIAGFLVSCSPSPKPDSIVLVIIDTCRADHVGAVRGENEVTPFLDAFAGEATTFTRAYSHAPWTLPSLASLFTSQIPMHHGAGGRLGEFRSLPEEAVTLAEACREAGLRTAAISNVQFLSPKYGTTQGFDHVDFHEHETNRDSRRAAETTDAALSWLVSIGISTLPACSASSESLGLASSPCRPAVLRIVQQRLQPCGPEASGAPSASVRGRRPSQCLWLPMRA